MLFLFAVLSVSLIAVSASADEGFHDESEAGVVITSGNTRANTFNFKQKNDYTWSTHKFLFSGNFLDTTSSGVESARSYSLGIRYEEKLSEILSLFVAQNLESDIFAGYLQRYNSDAGVQYQILKDDGITWNAEAGYRYTIENQTSGNQVNKSQLRVYTELLKTVNKNVAAKLWIEYLPNLSNFSDYRINSELSLSALLNELFSIKSGYLVKYINIPLPGVSVTTDTIFTTALVAKF